MKIILALLACVVMAAPPALAKDNKVLDITPVTSPGGLKAWLVEDHSLPIIVLRFSFRDTGSAYDPADRQGLARMASNTMDEGAGPLDSQSFQKELQDLAISLSFSADRDHFGGTLKTLTENKARAFELLRLAINEPRFDAEPLERMRHANLSRIRSSLSDPEWIAARIQNDKAFAGHPYAMNSGGTLSSLQKITAEDLRGFTKRLARERLVISAAGDITAAELGALADALFGKLPEKADLPAIPDTPVQNAGKTFVFEQDIPQTVVEIMQPGIAYDDPDFHAAQVMNYILGASGFGSRLTKEIREKRGLTYGIYTSLINMDKAPTLSLSTSTKNESAAQMMELIRAEWSRLREEPATQTEIETAKSYLVGSTPLSFTSTEQLAGAAQGLQLDNLPMDYFETRADKINATTAADVARVAKRLLDPSRFVTVLVGKPADISNAEIIKTLPNAE